MNKEKEEAETEAWQLSLAESLNLGSAENERKEKARMINLAKLDMINSCEEALACYNLQQRSIAWSVHRMLEEAEEGGRRDIAPYHDLIRKKNSDLLVLDLQGALSVQNLKIILANHEHLKRQERLSRQKSHVRASRQISGDILEIVKLFKCIDSLDEDAYDMSVKLEARKKK